MRDLYEEKNKYICALCGCHLKSRIPYHKAQYFIPTYPDHIRKARSGHEISCPECNSIYTYPVDNQLSTMGRKRIISSINKHIHIEDMKFKGLHKLFTKRECGICKVAKPEFMVSHYKAFDTPVCIQCKQLVLSVKRKYKGKEKEKMMEIVYERHK